MTLDKNNFDVGSGLVASSHSEDVLSLQLKIDEEGIIEEVDYKAFGRPSTIDSADYLPLLLSGLSVDRILSLDIDEMGSEDLLYGQLVAEAIRAALANYLKKRAIRDEGINSSFDEVGRFD